MNRHFRLTIDVHQKSIFEPMQKDRHLHWLENGLLIGTNFSSRQPENGPKLLAPLKDRDDNFRFYFLTGSEKLFQSIPEVRYLLSTHQSFVRIPIVYH